MRGILIVGLALLPAALPAQEPAREPIRLTLDDAVERAVTNGNEVRLAKAGVLQARGQVTQAWATALPSINASVGYTRTFASIFSSFGSPAPGVAFNPDTTAALATRVRYLETNGQYALFQGLGSAFSETGFGSVNSYVATLTVSQTLFDGGMVGAGIAGARDYERAARAQLDETRRDVTFRARQAYLNALYAERLVVITEASQAQVNEQLRRVEQNHRVGAAADYDLLRAQVEAANQEPLVIAARNSRDIALLELKRVANVPADQPVVLTSALLTSADSLPRVDFAALAGQGASRAAVDAAEATVGYSRQAVRYYRGGYYPSLRLSSAYGGEAYPAGVFPSGFGDFRRNWTASLTVSVPLFDGWKTRGAVMLARADLARAEAQLAQTRQSVAIEIEQARAEVVRAQALVVARRETVNEAARAQHLAGVRYANGIATALEVSDARLALEQASVNEAQATRDYLLALAALEKAVGHPVPLQKTVISTSGGQ